MFSSRVFSSLLVPGILICGRAAAGQDAPAASGASSGGESAEELAKKLSNPVSAMISVPLQIYYPSATNPLIGAKKWGARATALVLKQSGGWT
jgi:hypothetical protein